MGLLDELTPKFRQRCEAIATEKRHLLNLQAFDRLPADQLAIHLNTTILTIDAFPNLAEQFQNILQTSKEWSAAIVCYDPLQIVHNSNHVGARRESNLMHEFGHILLDHPMVRFDASKNPLRHKQYENEATYLGGCLQIPHRGLLWAIQKGMTLLQISEHFGASKEIVQFRSNAVGLKHYLGDMLKLSA